MSAILIAAHQTATISKLLNSFKQNLPGKLKASSSSDKKKKTFNTPYPPKDPPDDYNPECVNHKAFEAPCFLPAAIFRPFTTEREILGPDADKGGCYKNAEYFAYHRFTFHALQTATMKIREERLKSGGQRVLYEKEEVVEEKCDDN